MLFKIKQNEQIYKCELILSQMFYHITELIQTLMVKY